MDSNSQEAASSLERTIESENSSRSNTTFRDFNDIKWGVSLEAAIDIPIPKVPIDVTLNGNFDQQLTTELTRDREEFNKSLVNSMYSHANSKNSKREVTVNTSQRYFAKDEEENTVTRVIKNVNISRTLNFAFRQLNQEYIALTSLTDLQFAFHNGYVWEVVPISKVQSLLDKYVDPTYHQEIKDAICTAYSNVFDWQETSVSLLETISKPVNNCAGTSIPPIEYMRVRKGLTSTYTDTTGNEITVPGILTAAMKLTLATDSVIVDAVLGQGEALDAYGKALQEQKVRKQELENHKMQLALVFFMPRSSRMDQWILGYQ